jgi:uncharacterized membrane protein YhaH (DUF805 family)
LALAALLLVWPALWNGYPLMFADSGTYVIQVPTFSLGWDRPPFYSLFLLLFHLRLSLWPVVVAQAVAASVLLRLALRAVAPEGSEWRLVGVAGVLAVASSLPWFVGQVMPDLFTGLLVIALALLATRPSWSLAAAATVMIPLHLSHLPLAAAVLAGVLAWRRWHDRARSGWVVLLPPVLAAGLLLGTNLIVHGRASIAPFGGVFLLARLIEDGPARAVLARDCDRAGWALCRDRADLPPTADAILWSPTSPLQAVERAATDPRRVADEADAIVARTWRTAPAAGVAGGGGGRRAPRDAAAAGRVRHRRRAAALAGDGHAEAGAGPAGHRPGGLWPVTPEPGRAGGAGLAARAACGGGAGRGRALPAAAGLARRTGGRARPGAGHADRAAGERGRDRRAVGAA